MKVSVYKAIGSKLDNKRWFVILKAEDKIESLPEDITRTTDHFTLKKNIELLPGEQRIALDSDEAITSINQKGYYIQNIDIKSPPQFVTN